MGHAIAAFTADVYQVVPQEMAEDAAVRSAAVVPGHLVAAGAQRRRTGIEPASATAQRSPVLKTGGTTRHPDASASTLRDAGLIGCGEASTRKGDA
jgi:hypothetical protein